MVIRSSKEPLEDLVKWNNSRPGVLYRSIDDLRARFPADNLYGQVDAYNDLYGIACKVYARLVGGALEYVAYYCPNDRIIIGGKPHVNLPEDFDGLDGKMRTEYYCSKCQNLLWVDVHSE
jgi:hypothetical protein